MLRRDLKRCHIMPLLHKAVKLFTDRMPKVISPAMHAVIDYGTAATFFTFAGVYFSRNKKAALSCAICGGSELLTSMLTDYPGGVKKVISFRTHGAMDLGLATLVATMPSMMKFEDEKEARFFTMQSALITAATGLTDFKGTGESGQLKEIEEAA
jgi:hypothetical protein